MSILRYHVDWESVWRVAIFAVPGAIIAVMVVATVIDEILGT